MCKKNESKYKCPACLLRTCSLACVRTHKDVFSCSGKVDQSAFVQMKEFTLPQLKRDYNFLSEGLSMANEYRRTTSELQGRQDRRLKQLRYVCRKKRDIALKIASPIFARHRQNASYHEHKEGKIFWTLEIVLRSGERHV